MRVSIAVDWTYARTRPCVRTILIGRCTPRPSNRNSSYVTLPAYAGFLVSPREHRLDAQTTGLDAQSTAPLLSLARRLLNGGETTSRGRIAATLPRQRTFRGETAKTARCGRPRSARRRRPHLRCAVLPCSSLRQLRNRRPPAAGAVAQARADPRPSRRATAVSISVL